MMIRSMYCLPWYDIICRRDNLVSGTQQCGVNVFVMVCLMYVAGGSRSFSPSGGLIAHRVVGGWTEEEEKGLKRGDKKAFIRDLVP